MNDEWKPIEITAAQAWLDGFLAAFALKGGQYSRYEELRDERPLPAPPAQESEDA